MKTRVGFNTLINTRINELTQTEIRIYQFIKNNRMRFIDMSIAKLADAMNVGEASIVRFCKKLGYKGLSELKTTLRLETDKDDTLLSKVTSLDEQTNSMRGIVQQLANDNYVVINETLALQEESSLLRAADCLSNARQVYFYGIGMSAISVLYAKYRFMRIMANVDALIDNHTMTLNSNNVGDKDVVVAISHSGETRDVVDALKRVKEKGAVTIVISKLKHSSLSQYADVVLLTGGTSNPYQSDSSTITAAQSFMVDVLFNALLFINQGGNVE
ncbi:TPA: MurR/RpiR family transcriptional regulator, partial [Enterobacter kobei]|nr:MurR/RpiR family transcriptional regulator [Enterobacter kobei]